QAPGPNGSPSFPSRTVSLFAATFFAVLAFAISRASCGQSWRRKTFCGHVAAALPRSTLCSTGTWCAPPRRLPCGSGKPCNRRRCAGLLATNVRQPGSSVQGGPRNGAPHVPGEVPVPPRVAGRGLAVERRGEGEVRGEGAGVERLVAK